MKKEKLFALLSVIAIVFFSISCSDKDKDIDTDDEVTKLEFNTEEVINSLPDGLKSSDNEYAQQVVSYVESATDWSSFADNLEPPEDAEIISLKSANTNKTYKWSWSYGGYSYAFYWEYSDDASKRYWDLDIQYNNGPRYNYIEAWESKSGTKGEIKYNFQWVCASEESTSDCEDLYWVYTWEVDALNAYNFKYVWESTESEYEYYLSYDVKVNENGSGFVKYYINGGLLYYLIWDSIGNGSWTYYFGDLEQTGSWTV
ncbi:MAG: hypothetical protein JXA77_19255 [Bacteroidales bacterium]|nr:hypothetical protein [Bacteroidales bacterium]MBN2818953.1 hypothetical protein [Bacteroidales bacterium]